MTVCPHGLPSPASCLECMADGPVTPPRRVEHPRAERWITASFPSRCALGDCEIEPGDRIGIVEGEGWCCDGCAR